MERRSDRHDRPFYEYLQFISEAPVDDTRWAREIKKYCMHRRDQLPTYKEWLYSGNCLSEYYKLFNVDSK